MENIDINYTVQLNTLSGNKLMQMCYLDKIVMNGIIENVQLVSFKQIWQKTTLKLIILCINVYLKFYGSTVCTKMG